MYKMWISVSYTHLPDDEVGSGFDRYTIRLNSEHTLIKLKDLDLLKVGETMTMVYSDKKGLDQATGQTTWNDFRNAFKTSPLFPACLLYTSIVIVMQSGKRQRYFRQNIER